MEMIFRQGRDHSIAFYPVRIVVVDSNMFKLIFHRCKARMVFPHDLLKKTKPLSFDATLAHFLICTFFSPLAHFLICISLLSGESLLCILREITGAFKGF